MDFVDFSIARSRIIRTRNDIHEGDWRTLDHPDFLDWLRTTFDEVWDDPTVCHVFFQGIGNNSLLYNWGRTRQLCMSDHLHGKAEITIGSIG